MSQIDEKQNEELLSPLMPRSRPRLFDSRNQSGHSSSASHFPIVNPSQTMSIKLFPVMEKSISKLFLKERPTSREISRMIKEREKLYSRPRSQQVESRVERTAYSSSFEKNLEVLSRYESCKSTQRQKSGKELSYMKAHIIQESNNILNIPKGIQVLRGRLATPFAPSLTKTTPRDDVNNLISQIEDRINLKGKGGLNEHYFDRKKSMGATHEEINKSPLKKYRKAHSRESKNSLAHLEQVKLIYKS